VSLNLILLCPVKKIKVALCMLEIATGFTPGSPKCLKGVGNTEERKAKVTVGKTSNRAGATRLFCGQAAQKFHRVAPALDAFGVGLFSTVQR